MAIDSFSIPFFSLSDFFFVFFCEVFVDFFISQLLRDVGSSSIGGGSDGSGSACRNDRAHRGSGGADDREDREHASCREGDV